MKRLAILGVAVLLAVPAVGSAQFRPIFVSPLGGFGGPGFFGWPGYGGYGYPYTFGGMNNYSWPGAGYGYGWGGSPYTYASYGATTSYYTIPNVGMPWASLGGMPARWNGVDLTGAGNLATYRAYYTPPAVTTPKSGTLPAAYNAARDRSDFVPGDLHAHVRVRLPADGEVWIEGQAMRLANGSGRFVSPELEPGSRYVYEVRARWTDAAGRRHNEGRSVVVRAGEHVNVSFVPPRR